MRRLGAHFVNFKPKLSTQFVREALVFLNFYSRHFHKIHSALNAAKSFGSCRLCMCINNGQIMLRSDIHDTGDRDKRSGVFRG